MNGTSGLNQRCVQHFMAAGEDPVNCAFPETSVLFTTTPLFIMNSRFDPALDSISANIGVSDVVAGRNLYMTCFMVFVNFS